MRFQQSPAAGLTPIQDNDERSGRAMGDHSAIEWTEATWNPTTGCDRTSPGCDNCLVPDTPVLMADMSWRPIGKLVPGDQVVGFTEQPQLGQNRIFERATVVHAWSTRAEAVELAIGGRTVIASDNHRFLCDVRPYWREAARLTLRSRIVDLGAPGWQPNLESPDYLAGYVAGATAGDGTMRVAGSGRNGTQQSWWRVAVDANDEPVLTRLSRAFAVLGLSEISVRTFDGGVGGGLATGTPLRAPMLKVETRRMNNLVILVEEILPERDNAEWRAGFLAGFLDTDGCYSGGNLRFNQTKDHGFLDLTRRCMDRLGFTSAREDFRSAAGRSERLVGDLEEKIRFLSTVQPGLTRKAVDFYGRQFPAKRAVSVDGVRRVGQRELVDIQTTTGTFIAAGLATHNCYALTLSKRLKAMGQPKYQNDGDPRTSGPGFGLTLHPDTLHLPRSWASRRTIFVNSMSDLFHPDVPEWYIRQVVDVIRSTPQHQYQVLTKRSKRLAEVGRRLDWPPNLWMGVSLESSKYRFRIDHLRVVDAAIRFVSAEPLLGPLPDLDLAGIHWLIAGGESGPRARPMEESWVAGLRAQCGDAGVPFFFKQWGGRTPKAGGRELDGRTYDEMPEFVGA